MPPLSPVNSLVAAAAPELAKRLMKACLGCGLTPDLDIARQLLEKDYEAKRLESRARAVAEKQKSSTAMCNAIQGKGTGENSGPGGGCT